MNANLDMQPAPQGSSLLAHDALTGLAQARKTLPCKWFYDATGSDLFERITETPEYYPTRVEARLLQDLSGELAHSIPDLSLIIEPGSGSSAKTRILLETQPKLREYVPMDISADFLYATAEKLEHDFPHLKVNPLVCDFTALKQPLALGKNPSAANHCQACMVFFPGSTIGNFNTAEAVALLRNMRLLIARNTCWLLLGVDMTQDAAKLHAAYNDAAGITAQFNKNILARINRELHADFDLEAFQHRAIFNEAQHRVEMHLVSLCRQQVTVAGERFRFAGGETIHTENSYKYPQPLFESLLHEAGWSVNRVWRDTVESGFGVYLLRSYH
ncbi:MAG TPA: L-histidine N(alpha)-methyltransferase [Methylophilaceae bacterium]|nr:L-histidine N(alpha)-methyltransferase [Methylophilaceae bacterium]